MKTICRIVQGKAGYIDELNDKIKDAIGERRLISSEMVGFSSRWNHKCDYVIVKLIVE